MAAYTDHNQSYFSRRVVTFALAVGVQVAIVAALSSGLANRVMNIVAPPIQTDIVQEVKKRDQPPPPPPPKMERPPVEVPPPDVTINIPVETNSTAITDVTNKPVPKAPPPVPHKAVRTPPRLDVKDSPSTADYYPPASRRLSEQGTTTVNVCTAANGTLAGKPKIRRSSGSIRLDDAAVRWASHARFHPATDDGKPVGQCLDFNVKFVLTD